MKYIVTFAGSPGSSKTPIATYLSGKFGLPIFNNDSIRTEVTEDLLKFNEEEFRQRSLKRLNDLFNQGDSFILDVSIDREWENFQEQLKKLDHKFFIISLDLSRDFLLKLYKAKNYQESFTNIDTFISDNQNFLKKYSDLVNLSITDTNFINRLSLSKNKLTEWLNINGS